MPLWRDPTNKRRIALFGFYLLCVVPTVAVITWAIQWRLPGHLRQELLELGATLGAKVSADRIRHLRPGKCELLGFRLINPISNQPVITADRLLVIRSGNAVGSNGQNISQLFLYTENLECSLKNPRQFLRALDGLLSKSVVNKRRELRFKADNVILHSEENLYRLTDVAAILRPIDHEVDGRLHFVCADFPTPEPVQVRIGRTFTESGPETGVGVWTGNGAFPCTLLGNIFPTLKSLGPDSKFSGYLWVCFRPGGPDAELVGRFSDITLMPTVANRFFRGSMTAAFSMLRVRGGVTVKAEGMLLATDVELAREFVNTLQTALSLPVRTPNETADWVPVDALAIRFELDGSGLRISSGFAESSRNILAYSKQGLIIQAPPIQPIPVAAVAACLASGQSLQVPACSLTVDVLRWFSLADSDAEERASEIAAQVHRQQPQTH